jgi:hypothetical protein
MLPTGSSGGSAAESRSRKRRPAAGSRAHQQRSIPTHIVTNWNKSRLVILAAGIFCLGSMSLLPILLLESLDDGTGVGAASGVGMHSSSSPHVSVQSLLDIAQGLRRQKGATAATPGATTSIGGTVTTTGSSTDTEDEDENKPKPVSSLHDLEPDMHYQHKPVARGVAGRPREQTPAVLGAASRAHVECPELSVDSLAYWNDPVGDSDLGFQSPFRVDNLAPDEANNEHYISFSPDRGGWNNVSHCCCIHCCLMFMLFCLRLPSLVLRPRCPVVLEGFPSPLSFGRNLTCRLRTY